MIFNVTFDHNCIGGIITKINYAAQHISSFAPPPSNDSGISSTHLSFLFICCHPEDKLALGTLGVDDIVVHLLGLFHGIFLVDDRVHPA